MKKTLKNKKMTMGAVIILAIIVVVSGTFAWFTATDSKVNHLKTADNLADGVEIFEIFEEPDDWKPNQEITKNVGVINAGNVPVLVRLSFSEALAFAGAPVGLSDTYLEVLDNTCTHVHDALCGGTNGMPCEHDEACDDCTYDVSACIPVLFKADSFTNANGWYKLSTTPLGVIAAPRAALSGLALDDTYSDLEVWITCVTTTGSNPRTTYSVVAFVPINDSGNPYDGKCQKVSFDFSVNATTKVVALTDIKYLQLGARSVYDADWTDIADMPLAADIDYSVAEAKAVVDTSPGSPYGQYIEFIYNTLESVFASADGSWFYNEEDGWFYFLDQVAPGTITPNLLDSLKLDKDADGAYANLTLDLTVHMEAIQCTAEAVLSVFFGDTVPAAASISRDIYDKLIADYCD